MGERPWALVTGASSGIGEEFARQLAANGHDTVLVARRTERLEALAAELAERHGTEALVVTQDLSEPDAAERVAAAVDERGIAIEVLVNNAGTGRLGRADRIEAGFEHRELMVNVVAPTDLVNRYLPPMVERGGGAIVNVASLAGFQVLPYMAVYAAAKSYIVNYSLALWAELRGTGVKILAVCPGPVDTGFPAANRVRYNRRLLGWMLASPEKVVAQSLASLERNRGYVVPDRRTWFEAHLLPRRPRRLMARLVGRVMRYFVDRQHR
ncbi:SDR family NAD(P)-dependent oxidoreductase [Glycomyces xiaoerkulensis]|uniref:SDR family NAD(P)-dependent oxidoreductase n=1 Tax=Glycomyces xiaoerkulensis TaxID=2038139 RepID=UPI000C256D44|nr:SDR family oxidoreductase [Glycomyces xiaoerkulensis]